MNLNHNEEATVIVGFFKQKFADDVYRIVGKHKCNISKEDMMDVLNQLYDRTYVGPSG
jgi:hypothetical protein